MKLHYHPDTDSLYIDLKANPITNSREVADGLVIDLDSAGRVVGIDIQHASQVLDLTTVETESLPAAKTRTVGPSPSEFYSAFLEVVSPEQPKLIEVWNKKGGSRGCKTPYSLQMFSLFPPIAEKLGLIPYPHDYYTLDGIFYRDRDTDNFGTHETYACSISVALEHENICEGARVLGSTAEEMNKLQLFSAPLKVLITYPSEKDILPLLDKYAGIIKRSDVFDDISTHRRQLVIFGRLDDAGANVIWEGFEYDRGSFRKI